MAHSCRWRFPARPGGINNAGSGRRAGRIRVTASLRTGTGSHSNAYGLGPGFDAALQVSAAIGNNLQKFRDVFGEESGSSSGEEEPFCGFRTHSENRRTQSSARTSAANSVQEKKPRGRPPRALTTQRSPAGVHLSTPPATSTYGKPEGGGGPPEKAKRPPGRPPGSGEKRRGRPPASGSHRSHGGPEDSREVAQQLGLAAAEEEKRRKAVRRVPLGSVQQGIAKLPRGPRAGRVSKITKVKRLRAVKLAPLKSRLKVAGRKGIPGPVGPRRRRGRPPSVERLKAEAAAAAATQSSTPSILQTPLPEAKQKAFRLRRDRDPAPIAAQPLPLRASHVADAVPAPAPCGSLPAPLSAPPPRPGRPVAVRQSPRRIKPVRVVPPSKRTDATIAKQLLQRAKKGAQKKKLLEKEVAGAGGAGGVASAGGEAGSRRRRRTQLKNIRQFIMPVVSTVSLRIIKTPKRFIEDEASFGAPPPHLKMARLDAVPSAPASQPSTASSSSLVTPIPSAASAVAGVPASVPPAPPPSAPGTAAVAAAGLLHSSSCNNSTSNGRFSSSAASCGSSALSQHSSQLSSGDSSRSSSPSLDSSCDSQASEGTPVPSDEPDASPSSQGGREAGLLHPSRPPSPPSEPEQVVLSERGRRGRRGQAAGRAAPTAGLADGRKKSIISPATGALLSSSSRAGSQQASSTASSSSSPPPPPLLTPPQPAPSSASAISEHHPHSSWIMPPHPIAPFIPGPVLSPLQEKRHSILREPTFRWTSASRSEHRYFSSAKYAKEGLIRKPVFDNFRPPPLTAEDVGLLPPSAGAGGAGGGTPAAFPSPGVGVGAGGRLFSPLHHSPHPHPHPHRLPSSRFESPLHKRSPLLRAPQFTPSEAHSRIFESVTLASSPGSSSGSVSSLHSASAGGRTARRSGRRRRVFGPLRGQPRSPSHSMTTRSSQAGKGASELSPLSGHASAGSSPLPGVAVSPLAASALTPTPFGTFPPGSLGFPPEGPAESYQPAGRRAAGGMVAGGDSPSSSPLFPLFTPGPQATGGAGAVGRGGRERSMSASRDTVSREKDREPERPREREKEKENKKDGRKEQDRRGKGEAMEGASGTSPGFFAVDGKEPEDSSISLAPKKPLGRKKSIAANLGAEVNLVAGSVDRGTLQSSATLPAGPKGRLSKKGRPADRAQDTEAGESEKERASGQAQQIVQPGPPRKQPPVASLGSMLAQAEKQQVADKRVAGLLKKAKAQLFKIEKSKSLKTTEQAKAQGQESSGSEAAARGPRIKHVCRRAAVALGRNRAVFPDDMPTLSALPWEEREKILSSMGNDDKSSVAGSEEAEPTAPPIKPIKPITRHRTLQEPQARKGRRSRRCGQCPGCQVPDDCGVCTNCLDKPKFGGRNIKKQCCKVRKCQNLQWMPSKAFLQKQAKAKKDKKKNRIGEKKEAHHSIKSQPSENEPKPATPPQREEPARKKSETPPPKHNEEKQKQQQHPPLTPSPTPKDTPQTCLAPGQDSKQPSAPPSAASRKERKLQQQQQPTPPSSSPQATPSQPQQLSQQQQAQQSQAPAKKEGVANPPSGESKKKPQQKSMVTPVTETAVEGKQMKKLPTRCALAPKQKQKEKEKSVPSRTESSSLNLLSTPSSGGNGKQKVPCDGVHRIRVDFKEDHDIQNVWEMGGLSVLTSVPIAPRVICFLCASSGQVEFVFCQVCCEPFHLFCLEETERPLQEQWENWCCRRCRYCHVCGRQHQNTKQLLECDKCRNSYHPECLGPNHPTRPTKKKRVWICTKCVRCKSCGATTPGKAWNAQWSHDFSLCHDCAKLFAKGNFCPLCDKCYDDDDYESKMMQCGKCDRWVHAKCEHLTDEMYEILSNLPESVAYTCTNCTDRPPAEWRTALEKELQSSVRRVLTALLNSRTSTHLLRYRQPVMKPPELNPEPEESLPSRRSPEGPDPPVLTEVPPANDSPLDLESVKRKMDMGRYKAVLEFSDDIVKIIQNAINSDGGQPENKKANSMVKSFFIRQMERVFPWFKVKESRFWEPHKVSSNSGLLPNAVLPPSLDHNYAQWQERDEMARTEQPPLTKKIIPAPCPKAPGEPDSPSTSPPPPPPPAHIDGPDLAREDSPELLPPPDVSDNRQCALCLKYGDDNTNDGGRLLYIGQNEWTHVNCALWSAEVFEDDDGALKNVHMAVIRGRQLRCEHCQRPGATVGCCLSTCTSNYHFMCARMRHCVFLEDKKVYCQRHRDLIKGEVVSESGFEVTRRILVDFEGISLRRKFLNGLEPENVHMMIGSMTVDCLGILTELSDCERKLFPIGYQCSRVYWSTLDARKRCVYTCKILMCCPPVVEMDMNSTVEHEDNRTIAHSPPSSSEIEMLSPPGSLESPPVRPLDSQPSPTMPKPKAVIRSRHPSYPPCQRSPGSRPLPSTGGPSSSPHEIVTVGDPLLTPGLRSIGSRRHSTSSLSPPPPRGRSGAFSPASRDLAAWDTGARGGEAKPNPLTQHKNQGDPTERRAERSASGSIEPSSVQSAGSQMSPPLGTAVLFGHQRSSSAVKAEKGKTSAKELSVGLGLASRHSMSTLSKDAGSTEPRKELDPSLVPASKDTAKPGSPQPPPHKSAGRKAHDNLSKQATPTASRAQWASGDGAKPGSQAIKETRSKVRMVGSRETMKERGETSQNSVTHSGTLDDDHKTRGTLELVECGQARDTPLKARERFSSPERKNSGVPEGMHSRLGSVRSQRSLQGSTEMTRKDASPRDKKRTVKVTLTPLKMESNGTKTTSTSSGTVTTTSLSSASQGSQKRPSHSLIFPPCGIWDSSESDSQLNLENPEKRLFVHHSAGEVADGAGEGEDRPLEEDSSTEKHHEDDSDSAGSAKRRYPRRSARARSNMFFGLTPFYGVRSYGEEDLPFCTTGEGSGKRRTGGGAGKRSAQGQVDGADDVSTSSSGESGEDEEGGVGQRNEDTYYYNFTRTIVSQSSGVSPVGGMQRCIMGRGSQLHRFLKEERRDEDRAARDGVGAAQRGLGRPRIGQLDGVDDDSESDTSVSAATTTSTSTSTSTPNKSAGKRKAREARADKLDLDSGKDSETNSGGGGGSNSREGRKGQKENSLPLGGVKTQGQDPLEAQLSLNTDLLKSDSDNTNSDDCGNILPSDIMEFVLNTPSMQALGQQPEASSSELLSLEEGFGLDANRGKDISLFEDFSQPLPSTEPVESSVNASISGEESYGLPLELPSDLSVLTTRSPSVTSQNHSALIPDPPERPILSLPPSDSTVEKGVEKQRGGAGISTETQQGATRGGDSQVTEGHITPEHFMPGHMEADHMTSPPIGQAVEPGGQDLARTSGTPGLPGSPSVPLQGQKYLAVSAENSGQAQVASTAVQTTTTHLKPGTEKLIVVNQHMQPLYVLQTLPNGVTQKIQIGPSVTATGAMDSSSMGLATGLSTGVPASQAIFPPGGKGLVAMSHHPQIHAFSGATQPGFQSGIPSTTSGLLIGVHSQDSPIVVSEAGHRPELAPSAAVVSSASSALPSPTAPAPGQGKKRPISRLQPRKAKKLARSGGQPALTPTEVASNMTLINFSPSQIHASIPAQSGLVELGALASASTAPQRKVPNIIKRPKPGVVYFDPAPIQARSAPSVQAGVLGQESPKHLVPCTVAGLNPSQSLLNVVPVPAGGPSGLLGAGAVSLGSPAGLLGPADIASSISGLLLKAGQQSLALPEQQVLLQAGAPIISQLSVPAHAAPNTSGICVLPPGQTISMSVSQLQQRQATQAPADKAQTPDHATDTPSPVVLAPGSAGQDRSRSHPVGILAQSSHSKPVSWGLDLQPVARAGDLASVPVRGKAKRTQHSPDKTSGKKHKVRHSHSPQDTRDKQGEPLVCARTCSSPGVKEVVSPELMDMEQRSEREQRTGMTPGAEPPPLTSVGTESKPKASGAAVGEAGPVDPRKGPSLDREPKRGLVFEICSDDGFQIRSESIEEAWKSLTDKVQEARSNARLKELSFEGVSGLRMLGVIHDAVVFLLEQLHGARHCPNYRFRFHKPEQAEEPPINPHGAARAELHHRRSVFDMFNFLASKHRQPPEYNPHDEEEEEVQLKSARRATSMDLPMPMRFRHLKKASKEAVGVYRSAIHGRGLFCKRNIDAGEMVIEYSGNVIRSILTDKREKYYDGKGIGCYMFRIDDYEVVDATMHGNAARFINHSCEPNCYSRVINVEGQKHIVIFAMRKIYRGEELTYDYKFPIEAQSNKLPCNCGTKKCRKFLN
ncbi:histone-lysine N-methyltransferase 2A [Megalops cyprinoides]|uniref:histone-lysine N-methyltransferase 2A n=1 Tax=Megalops cyprinoides TaxID=118141 RepID=UPI0018641F73|nr:histone-lysine N-methyltransferase 2A [Megalops cyprinoides]